MDFLIGLAPSMSGISCRSSGFWLGGAHIGNIPGNTSQYLYYTIYNVPYIISTFSKCGITPSGKSLLPYNTSYRNNTGLLDIFNYISYAVWELLIVPSGNSYCTSIILLSRSFWICFMCTESVTLIISPMYSICDASRRWNRFCSWLMSAVIGSKTIEHLWLFGYIQMENYVC